MEEVLVFETCWKHTYAEAKNLIQLKKKAQNNK